MKDFATIKARARSLSLAQLTREVLLRAGRKARHEYAALVDRPSSTFPATEDFKRSISPLSVEQVTERIKNHRSPYLTLGLSDLPGTVRAVREVSPGSVRRIVEEANRVLSHKINVFETQVDLGEEINWHREPWTGTVWPYHHFSRTPIVIGGGSDIKCVWELSRFYHLVTLGQAYALTGDDKYTTEFLAQLSSWRNQNPPRFGVNWTVAMEAAIRAINLIAALELFRSSPMLDRDSIGLMLRMLLAHGRFIRGHLEFSYAARSNHYLSDLIGLAVIGTVLPEFAEASQWRDVGISGLLDEMDKQILPDGVDYELTTGYHRLVLEMYALLFSLMKQQGIDLPSAYWEKLRKMFDFIRHYLKPDGTAPLIGDNDDGRVVRFQPRPPDDHSYMMSIAAVLLDDPLFKLQESIEPEALWWFGQTGLDVWNKLKTDPACTPGSTAFQDSRIVIQRNGPLYAIIDCGDIGINGRGSHTHSDALSFEIFGYGRTLLRDPGTFMYTGDPQWRNRFRSTIYHNTVRIDDQDICEIPDKGLFALGNNPKIEITRWETEPARDVLESVHYGYARLEHPVLHRRSIIFDKEAEYWIVSDSFEGIGAAEHQAHLFEFCFHFDSGLNISIDVGGTGLAESETASIAIVPVSGLALKPEIVSNWISLSYGTKTPSFGIIYRLYRGIPFTNTMLVIPYRGGQSSKIGAAVGIINGERRSSGR